MEETQPSVKDKILTILKKLPYRKWWFYALLLILYRSADLAIERSQPVEYDHIALGFSTEDEMRSAFARGYHTRQKLEEMTNAHGGR